MRASRGGMNIGGILFGVGSAGLGFVLADGLDRFLATYNPSATTAAPTDKFTSSGAGTLANTLNIASMPNWKRIAAGVGVAAAPAIGSMYVKGDAKDALEGMALGAGISAFKTLWNTVLMPLLIGADTTTPALQKSYIARLYPSEVAAKINKAQVPSSAGALSGAPADVGPFALAGDSPYPDAATALGYGLRGDSPYPNAAEALRAAAAGVSGDSMYPSVGQSLRRQTGIGADPSAPPAAVAAAVNAVAQAVTATVPAIPPAQAVQAAAAAIATPNNVAGALQSALPGVHPVHIDQIAQQAQPHVARVHAQGAWQPGPPAGVGPGPQAQSGKDCGCVGDPTIGFAGFLGDAPSETPPMFMGDNTAT